MHNGMETSSSLSSWSQAFEDHPIVQTRTIERQLRSDIALSKEKLRNLVGGSYHDLLATSEQIVSLSTKATAVEAEVSELGRNCRPKQYVSSKRRISVLSSVAQVSLLHRCSTCIASCLKAGQIILAAKLLAISRLLHTSVSRQHQHSIKILDAVLEQLSRLRRRLLRRIDRRLDDAGIAQGELTEVICAFCLATSSSGNDAIRHFQHQRLGQIHRSAEGAHGDHQQTAKSFQYYIDSLRTTKLLLGQDVPQALRKLQSTAILQDYDVLQLEHLNLSCLCILIPTDIQTFTPYIKKGSLSEDEANVLLEHWSEEAFGSIQSQLTTHLEGLDDLSAALQLRQSLLCSWLECCFSTHVHADIFEILRTTLNKNIESIMQSQVSAIATTATRVVQATDDSHEETIGQKLTTKTAIPSIWSPALISRPLTKGADSFLAGLKSERLGSAPLLQEISAFLSAWCTSITRLRASIASLHKLRWQDHIEVPDDNDEERAKTIIKALSIDDPKSYEENLNDSLDSALASFQDRITTAAQASKDVSDILFLLRIIREATLRLSTTFPRKPLSDLDAALPQLHSLLAGEVVSRLSTIMEIPGKRKQIDVALLPDNLPSPTAFKTLRTLCRIMLEIGGVDTWTRAATDAVKGAVSVHVFDKERKQYYSRNGFDESYLRTALDGSVDEEKTEAAVRKAAVEYWRQTKLLFGVLNP